RLSGPATRWAHRPAPANQAWQAPTSRHTACPHGSTGHHADRIMKHVLLSAKNVTRRFGGLTALSNVSLALSKGCVHAVIGTNGAGKSTLVSVLAGEMAPDEGAIFLRDQDI